jgi:glycosyltransferase involved in cell wall biosynthesis
MIRILPIAIFYGHKINYNTLRLEERRGLNIKLALVTYGMLGGGIETYLINLGQFFKKRGLDVTVVTTEVPGAWFERLATSGIKAKYIDGLDTLFPIEHVLKVNEVLRQDGYDVIFLNHDRYTQAAINLFGNDTVIFPVVHGNDDVFQSISSYQSASCNGIVAVSPRLADTLERKKPECPIVVIPNGIEIINTDHFMQRTFHETHLRLIYVGRLFHEEKGIFFLPEILRKIKDDNIKVILDIVGDGNDRDELIEMLKANDVLENVHMWGTLNPEKVYELLCQAHFLIFPSYTEGLPCVPIEAQMCGCIPIASRLKGSTDILIKDNDTGILVDIGDVEAIYQAIIKLWKERDLLGEMSKAAVLYSRENFSLEAMGNKYYTLITDAVHGKYPCNGKRNGLAFIEEYDNENLLKTYFDILFISGTDDVKGMYKFWMKKLVIDNKPISEILYTLKVKKAAIFGTLKTALYLLKDLSMAGIEIVSFIDSNPEMRGKLLCGLPINQPSWLTQHAKEIDVVVVSIESASDTIVKEQLQKSVDTMKIFTWKELVRKNGFES